MESCLMVASRLHIISGSAFCFAYMRIESECQKLSIQKQKLWLFIKYVVNMFLIYYGVMCEWIYRSIFFMQLYCDAVRYKLLFGNSTAIKGLNRLCIYGCTRKGWWMANKLVENFSRLIISKRNYRLCGGKRGWLQFFATFVSALEVSL